MGKLIKKKFSTPIWGPRMVQKDAICYDYFTQRNRNSKIFNDDKFGICNQYYSNQITQNHLKHIKSN